MMQSTRGLIAKPVTHSSSKREDHGRRNISLDVVLMVPAYRLSTLDCLYRSSVVCPGGHTISCDFLYVAPVTKQTLSLLCVF